MDQVSVEIIALTLEVTGKILIAYTAIRVHFRVWKEHKIDASVFHAMRKEQGVALVGIFFIVIAYLIEMWLLIG